MNNFKRFLKSFTPYQKWYLIIVVAITALFVIFLPDMMLEDTSNLFVVICSVIAVIANPLCELMISKQSRYNFLVDIFLIEVPELVICWWNGWYTIAIVTIAYWIPVSLISYLRWGKHPDQEETEMTAVKTLCPGIPVEDPDRRISACKAIPLVTGLSFLREADPGAVHFL